MSLHALVKNPSSQPFKSLPLHSADLLPPRVLWNGEGPSSRRGYWTQHSWVFFLKQDSQYPDHQRFPLRTPVQVNLSHYFSADQKEDEDVWDLTGFVHTVIWRPWAKSVLGNSHVLVCCSRPTSLHFRSLLTVAQNQNFFLGAFFTSPTKTTLHPPRVQTKSSTMWGVQECTEQKRVWLGIHGVIAGPVLWRTGVGLEDHCESLPTQDILGLAMELSTCALLYAKGAI